MFFFPMTHPVLQDPCRVDETRQIWAHLNCLECKLRFCAFFEEIK